MLGHPGSFEQVSSLVDASKEKKERVICPQRGDMTKTTAACKWAEPAQFYCDVHILTLHVFAASMLRAIAFSLDVPFSLLYCCAIG